MRKNNSIRYLIFGRVQGVAFRAYTKARADELGIKGWVRNKNDGSVECMILQNQDNIEQFEKYLKGGSDWGRVDKIKKDLVSGIITNDNFEIVF